MFWSKIWFFLVAVAAALAISVALTMPRPAARTQTNVVDPERVTRARSSTEMLLRENARKWVDLAASFARVPAPQGESPLKLDETLRSASDKEKIGPELHTTALETLRYILSQVSGAQKPEFAIALDKWGRVVARIGWNEKEWGEDLSSYFLVRDALRGYLRDDLWYIDGKLYRVAAAPVIERGGQKDYVGAVVLGDEVDMPLARELEKRVGRCQEKAEGALECDPHVAFYVKGRHVVTGAPELTDDIYKEFLARKERLLSGDEKKLAEALQPFTVKAGDKEYLVAVKQLPGEAGAQDGFYALFTPRSTAAGFMGTLRDVTKDDIGFKRFPWILVGGAFLIAIALGMGLMWMESDRPLRRLVLDAVALGKGETEKLAEDRHRGKFGSIARSVNIAMEKLARDARQQKKDLGAVLGPPPEDGIFGPSGARPLPSAPRGPGSPSGSPFAPPPPSDFSFEPPPGPGPVSSAPLHLGNDAPLIGGDSGARSMPAGGGFDFEMPPPPPPAAPPPPPIAARTPVRAPAPPPTPDLPSLGAPPPLPPAVGPTPSRGAPRPAAPPPPLPMAPPRPVTPLPVAAAPPARVSPPPAVPAPLPAIDDDILAPNLDDDIISAASLSPPVSPEASIKPSGQRHDFSAPTVVADPSEDLLRQASDGDTAYYREVYDDFLELKRKCGESVEGLTYEKFAAKLKQNRDQLVAKYNCKAVKFQVYVKDGKAALKATPVKA